MADRMGGYIKNLEIYFDKKIDREKFFLVVEELPKRELLALKLYYGFGGYDSCSFRSVGEGVGRADDPGTPISGERGRQLVYRALRKLQHPTWKKRYIIDG